MEGAAGGGAPFGSIDKLPFTSSHLKVWLISGMGFFTDAYDLFVIGAILVMFDEFRLPGFYSPSLEGLLASSAIFAAVAGQLAVGRLADVFGRKAMYGLNTAILASGALLSAFSPDVLWLIAFRFILGVGIGGDYPLSSTIASEYSSARNRGRMVALVFASQGFGALTAVGVSMASAALLPPDLAWRAMAGLGAVPALAVIYFRSKLPETPRYSALAKGDYEEARRAARMLGVDVGTGAGEEVVARRIGFRTFIRRYWTTLVATSVPWFLMDIAFYGTGIYSGPIVTGILGTPTTIVQELFEAGVPFMVGFPGYFTAVALIDRVGRKALQIAGFIAMASVYSLISWAILSTGGDLSATLPSSLGLLVYSLSFYFINMGPNTTTFVIPSEVYPVRYRSTGHGISSAAGKAGAGLATLLLIPFLRSSIGLGGALEVLAAVSLAGAAVTLILREPGGISLEEASLEEVVPAGQLEAPPQR